MKFILSGFDMLFLARPVILIPVWGFSIFGYWCGMSQGKPFDVRMLWGKEHFPAFCLMIVFSLSVGAIYVLNQIADYKVDSENDGYPLLVKGNIQVKSAFIYSLLLTIFSIGIPLVAGYSTLSFFSGIAIVIGVLYSFKPFYFSGRPFADFLTNAIGFGFIAFGAGWFLVPGIHTLNSLFFRAALPYFFMMCSGSICSTLPDYSGDKANEKNTTAVVLGKIAAVIIAVVCDIVAVTYSFITNDIIAFLCAGVAFPIYILYSMAKSQLLMEATYKVRGGIGMLIAGIILPIFLIFAGITFIGTWLYFRWRHNVSYPSLVPVINDNNES